MDNRLSGSGKQPAPQSLPIKEILLEAARLPFQTLNSILRLCWPYILITLGISLLTTNEDSSLLSFLILPLYIASALLAAVSCHRLFLESPNKVDSLSAFRWTSRESRYFVNCLKMFFAIFILVLMLGGMAAFFKLITDTDWKMPTGTFSMMAGDLLGLIVFGYLFARICIMLPSAAVGKYYNLNSAWSATKPYANQLFILVALIPGVVAMLGSGVINALPVTLQSNVAVQVVISAVALIGGVIELCILSKSYEWMQSQEPKEEPLAESV